MMCLCVLSIGQDVSFSLTNQQDVVEGADTYYEVDVLIGSQTAAGTFTMGSGQIYLNYNRAAFGENVVGAGNLEIIYEESPYLLNTMDNAVGVIRVYRAPILNDNTASRLSVSWQQDRGAGCIATMVTDTPQALFKIRLKYATVGESPDLCFETDDLFIGQTFTACGPFDCTGIPEADCTNEGGMQIANDNFTCLDAPVICTIAEIPLADDINDGECITSLQDWQHLTNDMGEVLLSVNRMGNDLGNIAANLYVEDAPVAYNGDTFLLQRHYRIITENIPQSEVRLRLYFTEPEFANLMGVASVDMVGELVVAKYSGIGEDEVYNPAEGGTLNILMPVATGMDFNANYLEVVTTSFSEFWIQGILLPVELVDFQAINKQREVELKWQTATELNSDYFEVQRSRDGVQFDPIAKIQAAGTTSVPQNYIYMDTQPSGGYVYYRLEQFDIDNTSTYSNVAVVYRKSSGVNFSIFPNPAKDELFINYKDVVSGDLRCKIYNILGKEVCNMTWAIPTNERIEVPISQLSEGVYLIQLINGEFGETIEFIKH